MSGLRLDPAAVKEDLDAKGADGWLITDFKGANPVAAAALDLGDSMLTRRWALWLPAHGEPVLIVNQIEMQSLPDLGIDVRTYQGFAHWKKLLEELVGRRKVLLEWYPDGEVPYLSRVDGGLVDLLRSLDCELSASAGVSQRHLVLWNRARVDDHRRAAQALTEIVTATFDRVRDSKPGEVDEATVQGWIQDSFDRRGMFTDHAPIVAVDGHAGDPHYVPPREGSSRLGENFLLLIDLWAGFKGPNAAFADITWMARRGEVADHVNRGFRTVLAARDAGVRLLEEAWADGGRFLAGYEVDDAVRAVIREAGLQDAFIHRTGHSLGTNGPHGEGANLDGYEARDTRLVETGLAVTIEPGVYFPDWGIRSEINVVMDPGPVVTTPRQIEWVLV